MTSTGKRMSLIGRLTWQLSVLRVREWVVICIAAAALVGFGIFQVHRGGACVGQQLQMQIDLEQSDRDIASLAPQDRAGQCRAYRHRRDVLARAADLVSRCGIERSGRGSVDFQVGRDAQFRFYNLLTERQCKDAGP